MPIPERDARAAGSQAPRYAADKIRGGEIILRTRLERLIFAAGLVGAVILAFILAMARAY
jgi:hypothetical protein